MTETCTAIEHCSGVVERIELLADVEEAPTDGQWLPAFKVYDDIW